MDERAAVAGGPKRRRTDTPVARALIALAGLPPVLLGFLLFLGVHQEHGGYRTAPVCAAPPPRPDADCLLLESGRVTRKWASSSIEDGSSYHLYVVRGTGSGREYEVDESLYRSVDTGTAVDLKVWKGVVVRIAHGGHEAVTLAMPRRLWLRLAAAVLLISAGTVVTAYGLPGRNPRFRHSAPLLFLGTTLATSAGAAVLALVEWPAPLVLGLAAAAWLIAVPTVRYLHTSFS